MNSDEVEVVWVHECVDGVHRLSGWFEPGAVPGEPDDCDDCGGVWEPAAD